MGCSRPLLSGDIVNVDVTVFLDGVHGDTSRTFLVGDVDAPGRALVQATEEALRAGIAVCGPGVPLNRIGDAIRFVGTKRRWWGWGRGRVRVGVRVGVGKREQGLVAGMLTALTRADVLTPSRVVLTPIRRVLLACCSRAARALLAFVLGSDLADQRGYTVSPLFCGHGINSQFHTPPIIIHCRTPGRPP